MGLRAIRGHKSLIAGRIAIGCALLVGVGLARATDPAFAPLVIDAGNAGDCKMSGDIDGDGKPDAVIGGSPGENLCWYRWPTWAKTTIAEPNDEFTTDGELADVDGDGDLDIIVGDGSWGDNLVWFENPRPAGDPSNGAAWVRHAVAEVGDYVKDVEPADYDRDGRLDVAVRTPGAAGIFFRNADNTWRWRELVGDLWGEGMFRGDVDGDGDLDLVLPGSWLENPSPEFEAQWHAWGTHTIDPDLFAEIKAVVADINADGRPDVVFSCSECRGDVVWYSADAGDPRGTWTRHVIVPDLDRAHTLQAGDFDHDGLVDLLVAQMHTSDEREVAAYLNRDAGTSWHKVLVDDRGLHNGVLADFGSDGDLDIFGANWTGNPGVRVYQNTEFTVPGCVADMDNGTFTGTRDGGVTIDDVLYYIAIFDEGAQNADIDNGAGTGTPDGGVTIDDLLYYLLRFDAGC